MDNSVKTSSRDERIVQLVGSGAREEDDGNVTLNVGCGEEEWTPERGLRMTEDDVLALQDNLGHAYSLIAGREPQAFVYLMIHQLDGPPSER